MVDTAMFHSGVNRAPVAMAREVLSEYWNGKLPVNPGEIARNMGIHLVPMNNFGYPYSGHYRGMVDGVPLIEYNNTESPERRRFTVAHEIGHHVLEHGPRPRGDLPANFRAGTQDPRERAANQFAAELLMPAEALRTLVTSGKFRTVDELAAAFAVSKIAMGYRLTNLRLSV